MFELGKWLSLHSVEICGLISLLINIAGVCYAYVLHRSGDHTKRVLTWPQLYSMWLFAAGVLFFLPLCYKTSENSTFITPFLMSFLNSLKMFLADGDFELIKKVFQNTEGLAYRYYNLYAAMLFFTAPVMTFTNILSLFKNIIDEWRFSHWRIIERKRYIMSELNLKSLALARSIRLNDRKALIVFTDVFMQNEEADFELLTEARNINAILLKRDISHINILRKGNTEIFLVGESEAENVSQAVKITTELNELNRKKNVKIFVFSHSGSSAVILDSVKYENLLPKAEGKNLDFNDFKFKLRRVDEKRQLAWRTVSRMNVFEIAKHSPDGEINVLIAGMGSYGMEFFKTLIWFCQFEGVKINITIVDKEADGDDGKRSVASVINHNCPDLLKYNRCEEDGEAQYDIEIIPGIDMQNDTFENIVFYRGADERKRALAQRIKKCDIAIISLGDDDLNIETAINLRQIFDKIHMFKPSENTKMEQEAVDIYAVVYDEQKSGALHSNDATIENTFLRNCKNEPYHIKFIGSMSDQFKYENIYDEELEKNAYYHHRSWVDVDFEIYGELIKKENSEEKIREYREKINYLKENELTTDKKNKDRTSYEKYEYFRLSSMAKEIYIRALNESFKDEISCSVGGLRSCECEGCVRRKKSEHMRWNAYMRSIGYSYRRGQRSDRARVHSDLVSWHELSYFEKMKD